MLDGPSPFVCLPLPDAMIVEIAGVDAAKVLNNLSTNEVGKLPIGDQVETFVTDLRGWTVAHGFLLKLADRVLLVGQHPQPQLVCQHIDRYIIREDARVSNLTGSHVALLRDGATKDSDPPIELLGMRAELLRIAAPVTSPSSELCLIQATDWNEFITGSSRRFTSVEECELLRIRNFWPIMGREIREKCIPQELDRDGRAISFTKGCYLGQETIARLDARGQLQKKLCLLRIDAPHVEPGATILKSEKEVGQVTSAAFDSRERLTYALGFLRRGNFEPGNQLLCQGAPATVVDPATIQE